MKEQMAGVTKEEETGSPGWGASFFMQTTEDVAKAVAAAMNSPRPSILYSSKNEQGGSQLQRLQYQVTKMIKGFSRPPEVKYANYNPEILTSQKRQWAANFHLQYNDHRSWKEPTRLFESMVVVGLHPNCDTQALERQYLVRKSEGSGKLRSALGYQNQSRVEPNVEPQVLFVYPPEKQLPLKEKDLLSFCFPGGLEVNAVERTPSMSELNEILFGQEHLKQRDLSFVFRLQGADNSTLYGCCVLVEELVHKPSGLLSMISDKQSSNSSLRRHILTTQRCYCILSRLPFFELHFGVLNSIFMQERLERLTKSVEYLDLEYVEGSYEEENSEGNSECGLVNDRLTEDKLDENPRTCQSNQRESLPENIEGDSIHPEKQMVNEELHTLKEGADDDNIVPVHPETAGKIAKEESGPTIAEDSNTYGDALVANKQSEDRRLPNAVLPLLRHYQYESSESSCSFQGSPCEDRNFRSDADDTETEASFSGQEDLNDLHEILEWAKANNCGPLQIISEYYRFRCPTRGSTLIFHPLEHLHPLEYHRLDENDLYLSGSTIDLKSYSTGLELAEAQNSLLVAEEATALSVWAVACLCGTLRLEHVLTFFAGALLEKQIVVVCSNLGILSAAVLSVIPLIRPYQWQSLLMPVLPNDMLDFLDAPVPYIVGVRNKTNEVQSKLTNVILVDANRNQVKSPSLPQLPRQKELMSSLRSYHATLVGESYLGRRRPVYECTEMQVEAAKGFLSVLRSYLDSLCCNIRSHTITNVQSNDDKVSLLLRESFIDSFPYRDRPFMKLFVDTQLFSVHTDLVLSYFQKE